MPSPLHAEQAKGAYHNIAEEQHPREDDAGFEKPWLQQAAI